RRNRRCQIASVVHRELEPIVGANAGSKIRRFIERQKIGGGAEKLYLNPGVTIRSHRIARQSKEPAAGLIRRARLAAELLVDTRDIVSRSWQVKRSPFFPIETS